MRKIAARRAKFSDKQGSGPDLFLPDVTEVPVKREFPTENEDQKKAKAASK